MTVDVQGVRVVRSDGDMSLVRLLGQRETLAYPAIEAVAWPFAPDPVRGPSRIHEWVVLHHGPWARTFLEARDIVGSALGHVDLQVVERGATELSLEAQAALAQCIVGIARNEFPVHVRRHARAERLDPDVHPLVRLRRMAKTFPHKPPRQVSARSGHEEARLAARRVVARVHSEHVEATVLIVDPKAYLRNADALDLRVVLDHKVAQLDGSEHIPAVDHELVSSMGCSPQRAAFGEILLEDQLQLGLIRRRHFKGARHQRCGADKQTDCYSFHRDAPHKNGSRTFVRE